jgi:hypothetical protein
MAMAKPSSAKEQDNLVCQDVIRNGLDRAVDVTQTLRDGAPSAQDLTSRPASGRLTAFLKLDVKQLKEPVAAPPRSGAASSRRNHCSPKTTSFFPHHRPFRTFWSHRHLRPRLVFALVGSIGAWPAELDADSTPIAYPSRCAPALSLLTCYINSAQRAPSPDATVVSTGVRFGMAVPLRHAGCRTRKQNRKH